MSEELADNQSQEEATDQPTEAAETTTTEPTTWKDGLDDNIKSHPSLDNVKDISTLAKNYVNAQELIGRKGIIRPKEGDAEDLARFRRELGAAEKAEEYELGEIELDDELKPFFDGSDETAMKELAYKHGLPKEQFKELSKDFKAYQAALIKQHLNVQKEKMQDAEAELRKEYGQAYDEKVALAEKAYKAAGGEGDIKTNPSAIKAWSKVGSMISDDVLGGAQIVSKTPADAAEEIKSILGDPKSPIYQSYHPEKEALNKKLNDLYKQAGKRVY